MMSALAFSAPACAVSACTACATFSARRMGVRVTFGEPVALATLCAALTAGVHAGIAQSDASHRVAVAIVLAVGAICAVTDARSGYVFDTVTLPGLVATVVAAACGGWGLESLRGAIAAGGVLAGLHVLSRGRGLGFGDVKLGACVGAALGFSGGLEALGAAFVAGGAYGTFLLLSRRAGRRTAIAFAPYIAGGVLVLSWVRA